MTMWPFFYFGAALHLIGVVWFIAVMNGLVKPFFFPFLMALVGLVIVMGCVKVSSQKPWSLRKEYYLQCLHNGGEPLECEHIYRCKNIILSCRVTHPGEGWVDEGQTLDDYR